MFYVNEFQARIQGVGGGGGGGGGAPGAPPP